jgi:hypothetical protein
MDTKMTRRQFSAQFVLTIAVFVLFNAGIAVRSNRLPSRTHLLLLDNAGPFDALFLGNSLMANGLKTDVFNQASGGGYKPLNLGLNSSRPVEHYLLLRRAVRKQPHLNLIVYGYFDEMLTERVYYSNGLSGHQTLAYVLEPDLAQRYYTNSLSERVRFWISSRVPYLTEQMTLWQKVEQLRRKLASMGLPLVATNEFGRVEDFKGMEPTSPSAFAAKCAATVSNDVGLSGAIHDLITTAREHASRVVIVRMPMTRGHRASFNSGDEWRAYLNYTRGKVLGMGAEYIDASSWIPEDSDFEDAIHLNANGAQRFSAQLGRTLGSGQGSSTPVRR